MIVSALHVAGGFPFPANKKSDHDANLCTIAFV